MEKIEIGYINLNANGKISYYHKYILYTDANGNQFAARGGPASSNNNDEGFGNLVTTVAKYDENFTDYDDGTHTYETIIEAGDLSGVWEQIQINMYSYNNKYMYHPISYNSNTAVDDALCDAGLPLPKSDGMLDNWAPASLDEDDCSPLPVNFSGNGSFGPSLDKPEAASSPIILDLDRDGIETLAKQAGIFFDHDGNHFAENTGWVSADDGLLVIDKDGNGKIDSGNELFGNNTVLSNGSLAANGYEALQELDTNGDGTLNSRDEAWQQLQVWQDRNGNARVDDGELMSLSEAGIAAIDTDYKNSTWVDKQGNAHKQTGEVIYLDGSEGQSADVWFDVDKGYTSYTLDIVVPQSVRALPWVRGFGNMTDLHVAMSLNPELQAMVEQYIVDPLNSQALLQDIIFTWAGVADIAADSRGENIDARQLSVLEKATGENYQNKVNGTTDPLKNAAVLLEDEYKRFSDFIEASLLSQTLYRDDFATISLTMKSDYSGLTLNFDDFASHLESIKLTDVNEYLHLRKTFYALFEYSPSYSDVREQLGIPSEQSFFGDDGNNTFSGSKTHDYIWGNKGDDTLKGGYGSDTYLFNMGDGKDYISEGSSNAGDIDTLRFGEGINPEDVILQRKITTGLKAADSLIITFRDSTDSITIDNFFSGTKYQVEAFIFTDGTVWHVDTIKARLLEGADDDQTITAYAEGSEIHAAGGNDSLQGADNSDQLYGDAGDDTLVGGKGADILSGGTGNDTLKGGYGSDTYLFNMGDGKDYISEGSSNAGDIDTLRFGEGINPEDVILQRKITTGLKAADSLVITFRDSADSITIDNFFREGKYQVEELVFANGTVWDVNTVKAMSLHGTDDAQTITAYAEGSEIHAAGGNDSLQGADNSDQLYGDAGDDTLVGGKGADILSGGTGNDTLKGGYGSDTYLFNAGDGNDYLYEGTSNAGDVDTLRFGEGINPEDVIIQRRKTSGLNARDSLIITFRDSTDSITLDDFFRAAKYQVEHITFADGTDWLPEDILNYLEDDIPLPIAAPPDTPVSMSLLRQEMAAFSGGEYDDEAGVVVNTTLATARTTVNSLVSY